MAIHAQVLEEAPAAADYPPSRQGATAVGVLFFAFLVAYLDRQVMGILIPDLRASLGVSDTQVSLLQGIAFSAFFALAGLPLGRLADRANRRNLIAIGIAVWSLATIACGLASNFWQLFAARMLVGAGEACLAPASVSLIADCFPPARRGRAITLMQTGMPLGTTLALWGGGLLLSAHAAGFDFGGLMPLDWPAWKAVFLIIGAPGLLVALAVALLPEPPRREISLGAADRGASLFGYLRSHSAAFLCICAINTLNGMIGYGVSGWAPTVLMRIHHLSPAEAGGILALILLTCAATANAASGFLSDALTRWRPADGRALPPLILFPMLIGALVVLTVTRDVTVTIAAVAVSTILFSMISGTVFPALQAVTPNPLRGQVIALVVLVSNLLGLGLAPTLMAFASDYVMRDEMKLQQAVGGVSSVIAVMAFAVAVVLPRAYRRTQTALAKP